MITSKLGKHSNLFWLEANKVKLQRKRFKYWTLKDASTHRVLYFITVFHLFTERATLKWVAPEGHTRLRAFNILITTKVLYSTVGLITEAGFLGDPIFRAFRRNFFLSEVMFCLQEETSLSIPREFTVLYNVQCPVPCSLWKIRNFAVWCAFKKSRHF